MHCALARAGRGTFNPLAKAFPPLLRLYRAAHMRIVMLFKLN